MMQKRGYERGRQRDDLLKVPPAGRAKDVKIMFSYEEWTAIHDVAQRDGISTAEAVRRLVARGLLHWMTT